MKPFHWLAFFLAVFLLLAGIMPCVSAFSIASTNIDPRGPQAPGTPMTVSAAIDFTTPGNQTFPQDSELQLQTGLVNAYWEPVLVLDGAETHIGKNTGPLLKIPGWYLSYPSGQVVQLKVTLTGKIPADTSSSQDLLMIEEIDAETSVRSTARIAMPEAPLLTLSTPTKIPVTKKVFTPIPTATTTTQE